MRNVIFLFIAGIAGLMGYMWVQPVCDGGSIVKDEAACRGVIGFDVAFCRDVFSRTAKIASEVGPAYANEMACREKWPVCDPHGPGAMQWGVRPAAWCVVRAGGSVGRIEPQYDARL